MAKRPHEELRGTASVFVPLAFLICLIIAAMALMTSSAVVGAIGLIWFALVIPIRDTLRCIASISEHYDP